MYHSSLGHTRFHFDSLRSVMAAASSEKSGDQLAGIAASSQQERIAARFALADLPLQTFLVEMIVPYENDEVTRLIIDDHDSVAFQEIGHLTVGGLRDWLLAETTQNDALARIAPGLTPEMAAAVSKIMRNQDLIAVARKCRVITSFRNTIGSKGCLSIRLQPNHPTDEPAGIAASILDGLHYGAGDAVIGINPVMDSVASATELLKLLDEMRERLQVPTQMCVLTHLTNSIEAIEIGAPVDLIFQSIAGTEGANSSFGINLNLLAEGQAAALSLGRGTIGSNVTYFETGQGSALSADAHHSVDQQTLEARAYAVARRFSPLLVNSVVGFIGPEYLYNGKQIIRAGLEDHFCGKLLGLPMGLDICYTNHVDADQDDSDTLLALAALADVTFIMGIPGGDDVMLHYQSTSFHDGVFARTVTGKRPAPEFQSWLEMMGLVDQNGLPRLSALAGPSGRLLSQLEPML
jgi:ethanolamine ammonia-lyase large subunit